METLELIRTLSALFDLPITVFALVWALRENSNARGEQARLLEMCLRESWNEEGSD